MTLRTFLVIVIAAFPISETILAYFKRSRPDSATLQDQNSMRMIWIVIAASITAALLLRRIVPLPLPLPRQFTDIAALALLLIGLGLRWVSIMTLGRFFTVNVAIREDHKLVETGVYRYVRHPSYTGLLMAFTGVGVFIANWLSLIVVLIPITWAVIKRITVEEQALLAAFGAPYQSYCQCTKRLIPGIF